MVIKRKGLLSGRRKAGDNWGSERQVPGRSKEVGKKATCQPQKRKTTNFQTACKGGCGRERKERLTLPGKANGEPASGHLL